MANQKNMSRKIKRAIISLSDKTDLKLILKALKKYNTKIISSGGTSIAIKKLGYKCTELSKYTGFKEMLDGRVKTLHPKIHAGILHDRQNKKHKNEMSKQNLFKYIREYQAIVAKYPRQGKGIEPLCSDVGLEDPGTVYRNNEEKVIEKTNLN